MRSSLPMLLVLLSSACAPSLEATRDAAAEFDSPQAAPPGDYDNELTGGDTAEPGEDEGDDGAPALGLLWVEPSPEEGPHHYRQPLRVGFDTYAAGVSLRLLDADGASVPVEQEWDADYSVATLWPRVDGNAPTRAWLRPSSAYTLEIGLGSAFHAYEFETSDVGTPVDVAAATRQAYVLDFAQGTSNLPGLAQLVASSAPGAWIWQFTSPADDGDEALDLDAGFGGGDAMAPSQDVCQATTALSGDGVWFGRNPYFELAGGTLSVAAGAATLGFDDAWFGGDFSPDGAELVAMAFAGWLRADSIDPLVGDACALAEETFAASCQPCPSDEAAACLWLEFDDLHGSALSYELADVDPSDVDEDGACDDAPPLVPACAAGGAGGGILLLLPWLLRRRLDRGRSAL